MRLPLHFADTEDAPPRAIMRAAIDSTSAKSTLPRWLPVIVWAITFACQFLYTPNTDSTWLLTVAARVMAGSQLYSSDIVELTRP